MQKCKIWFIGLLSQFVLYSCLILKLEPRNDHEGHHTRLTVHTQFDEGDLKTLQTRRDKREVSPDTDYDYDDTEDNPDFEELFPKLDTDSDLLFELDFPQPSKVVLNVNVYLDKDWYELLGTLGGSHVANRIMKQASLFLAHDSLATKIKLVYDTNTFYNSSQNLVPSKEAFYDLLPQELIGPDNDDEGHPTAHVYLSVGSKHPAVGKSLLNGMCTGSEKDKPRVIVRVTKDEIRTAMTVAHEIGHLLGMEHDFKLGRRGRKCGKGKESGELVMNYGSNRQIFSDCSNEDFKIYYDRVFDKNGKFCLKSGVEGCACNGRKDGILGLGGECTNGPDVDWCFVNQDSGCADLSEYHGKWVSYLPCTTDYFYDGDDAEENPDKVIAELTEPNSVETNEMDDNGTESAEVDPTNRMERENEDLKKSIESYKTKVDELEINVLNSQIEVSALTEEVQELKEEQRMKDQQNAILLGEKNSSDVKICELENRVFKINGAIHRIFKEKESLKQVIENQKITIDFLQNKSPESNAPPTNGNAAETIKKLNENLKVKTKDLVEERKKNKELVEELSELQNKLNGKEDNSTDTEKCVKLTKVVSNKSKEIVELKNENKALKEKGDEYLKKMNEASSKVTSLEIKNTRLENQVENLIEAVGKKDSKTNPNENSATETIEPQAKRVMESPTIQKTVKCRHNDKAVCTRKETCQFAHIIEKYQSLEGTRSEKKEGVIPVGWMQPSWSAAANPIQPFQPQAAQNIPPFQPQGMGQSPAFQQAPRPLAPNGSQWIQQLPQQVSFHPSVHQYQV